MAIPALFKCPGGRLTYPFLTTAAVAIVKGQLVAPGADDDTITGTTSTSATRLMGVALADVLAGDAGPTQPRIEVHLLQSGAVIPMIVGAAVTAGSLVICNGTAGRIADAGATPDARTVIGRALASSSTAGDLVPVMVGA